MGDMNRAVLILIGCVVATAFTYHAHAQGVQSYLNDNALATAHVEVVLPDDVAPQLSWWAKIWSHIGIRSTVRIRPKEGTVLRVVSSAYASSPYQTDSTPCITAAGTTVRPGVVATNFLPLGTIVSIDEKKYIVEDRMNSRYDGYYLDIWFPSTSEALEFGRKKLNITILAYDKPGAELSPSPSPQVAEVPPKTLWQSVSSSASSISEFLFTRIYSNPNKYDVDCTK
jgi:3D (Asp-Asp-Asp) domain-containing protein